ncbi:4-(cytidine 5'-diphospho)-2-C-methyl-D-erythritol kinase [Brevundimonas subvibrioides]|uniref:4-(cytidine 5'-diphospho)-2-C-methyl-D-erythritol kinase n=1 Tax=Brevundimonas subvibrioides TaxID=74313 RepID=UPI0032D5A0F2
MATLSRLAPAKVNLFLHVGAVQPNGYHPLSSLVAFADVGDLVTVEPADRLSLTVTGPFAGALDGQGDNLILKALRALAADRGLSDLPLHVTLDKRLPIAAGLGGGSSDAGAALRLADEVLGFGLSEDALEDLSRVVGADGPMCLRARSAWAEGVGEVLVEAPDLPALHAVLYNPGRPSPTGAVYRAYDADPSGDALRPAPPPDWTRDGILAWLGATRNDLERPAVRLEPAIGAALEAMARQPDVRFDRMSGSGATVFGLFDTAGQAASAAANLHSNNGSGWAVATLLGGNTVVS